MGQALPEDLVKSMENLSNELIESRKQMKAPTDYIKKDDLARFTKIQQLSQSKGEAFDVKESNK
jgi:hypothetical protein